MSAREFCHIFDNERRERYPARPSVYTRISQEPDGSFNVKYVLCRRTNGPYRILDEPIHDSRLPRFCDVVLTAPT